MDCPFKEKQNFTLTVPLNCSFLAYSGERVPVLPGLRGEQCDEELQAHPGLLPQILQGHPQLQETSRDGSQVRYFFRKLGTIRPEFILETKTDPPDLDLHPREQRDKKPESQSTHMVPVPFFRLKFLVFICSDERLRAWIPSFRRELS